MEIGGRQLTLAGARHQIVEGIEIVVEGECAGVLDIGDHQAAPAVFTGDVDGDAEIDLRPYDTVRLTVALGISVIDRGDFVERFDNRPADDVGEGDFSAGEKGPMVIDDAAVLIHHLDGDDALRSGQRHSDAGGHIFRDLSGNPAQRLQALEIGSGEVGRRGKGLGYVAVGALPIGLLKDPFPAVVNG